MTPIDRPTVSRIYAPIRLALFLVLCLLGSHVASAQADPGAVTEVSRNGRRIVLNLRSGPHPYAGDYPVTVSLPSDYDAETAAYRVLYIFDGMDFGAEYDALMQDRIIHPAILVSIANKTSSSRNYDLTPSVSGANTGGLEVFADLITRQLKAYIDTHFRTRPEPASTGVIGNSLGGLAACWLGYMHPETFGLAGVHEPSLWWNGNQLLNMLRQDTTPKNATRFWIMAADQEYESMWKNAKLGAYALKQRGWIEGEDVAFCQVHNYSHGSAGMRVQIRSCLHFLLRRSPAELIGAELTNCHGPQLVPLRPADLGGAAYAYLDLRFRHDLRATAIAPELELADPRVASLVEPVLGQLIPVGPGWTTVSANHRGFRAIIDVQGIPVASEPQPPARPGPPTIVTAPTSRTVALGGTATFSTVATGSGPLTYQWHKDGMTLAGATDSTFTLNAGTSWDAGSYSVCVTGAGGSVESEAALVTVTHPSRLTALAVRTESGPGDDVLIVGLIIAGTNAAAPKPLVVRGVGPGLAVAGLASFMRDPLARVFAGPNQIGENDDWSPITLRPTLSRIGLDNLAWGSRDAALLTDFASGAYTVHLGAKTTERGVVQAEVYELAADSSRLSALAVRAKAGTGEQTLIGGFVIGGIGNKRVLIRGLGPALAGALGAGYLSDPKIDLYSGSNVIQSNDNWTNSPDMLASLAAIGMLPAEAGSRDAALVADLPPGAYSVHLSGANGSTGIAMIEIYELP